MGFFDRIRARLQRPRMTDDETGETRDAPSEVAEEPSPKRAPVDPRLSRLARVGHEDGPSEQEAATILRSLRVSPLEPSALATLATVSAAKPLGDELASLAAKACADRGELAAARSFLRQVKSPDALILAADLAEEDGDSATALALVERVLAHAIDHPGARERHARIALLLGRRAPVAAPSTPANTVLSAQIDSPYVMRRELARGGAAAVYEAEDRELGRRIALKVYHDAAAGRDQLLHEARVATELAAPGIIRVFDVDLRGGWLVLEYFEHGSLREWIRSRPTELRAGKLEWLTALARTLAAVHARGYAHLDVKPGNVLLRHKLGLEAVLADFGSARRIGAPSPAGSLGYVSPERLAGAPASPLDDAYGLGRIIQDVFAAAPAPGGGAVSQAAPPRHIADLAARLVAPANERLSDLALVASMIEGGS